MTLFSPGFQKSCFFLGGGATHIVLCVQQHQLLKLDLSVQERETLGVFCVQQHLLLILELVVQTKRLAMFVLCSSIILYK
jgi:hypothetical protein